MLLGCVLIVTIATRLGRRCGGVLCCLVASGVVALLVHGVLDRRRCARLCARATTPTSATVGVASCCGGLVGAMGGTVTAVVTNWGLLGLLRPII